jgi:hypothetical protein
VPITKELAKSLLELNGHLFDAEWWERPQTYDLIVRSLKTVGTDRMVGKMSVVVTPIEESQIRQRGEHQ